MQAGLWMWGEFRFWNNSSAGSELMIRLSKISKKFGTGTFGLSAIDLSIEKGEFVFLVGPTGSGKTTIFRLIIREILPTEGVIIVDNWDVVKLPHGKIPNLRKKIGVVFQDLKLLKDRTVFENVMLPLEVSGVNSQDAQGRAMEVLEKVGIKEQKDKFPLQLSGGEVQRVAIARALTLEPQILLADEPTGNLDYETANDIVKLLSDINEKGTTVVMATHNQEIVGNLSKRIVKLDKGRLIGDEKSKSRVKRG